MTDEHLHAPDPLPLPPDPPDPPFLGHGLTFPPRHKPTDGAPDQTNPTEALLSEWNHGLITNPLPLDPPGLCPRCKLECRDFTEVDGKSYCDKCGEIVRDYKTLFKDCKALVGTGEP